MLLFYLAYYSFAIGSFNFSGRPLSGFFEKFPSRNNRVSCLPTTYFGRGRGRLRCTRRRMAPIGEGEIANFAKPKPPIIFLVFMNKTQISLFALKDAELKSNVSINWREEADA